MARIYEQTIEIDWDDLKAEMVAELTKDLEPELTGKKQSLKSITPDQLEGKYGHIYKAMKRLLSVDILLMNGLIRGSSRTELKRLQVKQNEALGCWLEVTEACGDGYYLKVSNELKDVHDRYDDYIEQFGV